MGSISPLFKIKRIVSPIHMSRRINFKSLRLIVGTVLLWALTVSPSPYLSYPFLYAGIDLFSLGTSVTASHLFFFALTVIVLARVVLRAMR